MAAHSDRRTGDWQSEKLREEDGGNLKRGEEQVILGKHELLLVVLTAHSDFSFLFFSIIWHLVKHYSDIPLIFPSL